MDKHRRIRFRCVVALTALGLALPGVGVAFAAGGQIRIGLVVGNNVGNDPSRQLKYAEEEVGRVAGLLRASGDFSSIVVVRGGDRSGVEDALQVARTQVVAARRAGRSTMFLFYYSGHGDNEALELGATRLPLRDLRQYLESSPAEVKLAFVDACQSGALTGVKGGRRAPAYEVRLADPGQTEGLAIVTSSSANELSQESDDLRGSFFSQNLMAGLRGLADSSGDGQVSLQELYQFAYRRTLANTAASFIGGQHPTFVFNMKGAGDVILTRSKAKDARLQFPRESGVTYSVLSGADVTAELVSSAGEDQYLAVPAGEYRVIRRALAAVSERAYTLAPGTVVTVQPDTMLAVAMNVTQRKKGGRLFLPNQVGADLGVRSSVEPGASGAVAAFGLSYARHLDRVALRVRADIARFDGQERNGGAADVRYGYLRTGGALDLLFSLWDTGRASVLLGPTVSIPVVWQSFDGEVGRSRSLSLGLGYGGMLTATAQVTGQIWLVLNVSVGAETFLLNGARQATRGTAGGSLGGAVSF